MKTSVEQEIELLENELAQTVDPAERRCIERELRDIERELADEERWRDEGVRRGWR